MTNKTIFLLVLIVFTKTNTLFSCFCEPKAIEELKCDDIEEYDEFFLGEIINMKRLSVPLDDIELIILEVTFEVIKKWKGNDKKILKIYQGLNSCSTGFNITHSRWIVAGYMAEFSTRSETDKYPGKYLQTSYCAPHFQEQDYNEFNRLINKIDNIFPNSVLLNNTIINSESNNIDNSKDEKLLKLIFCFLIIGLFVVYVEFKR